MWQTLESLYVQNKLHLADKKSAWKRAFTARLNQCKQKHGTILIYMKNSELCIM